MSTILLPKPPRMRDLSDDEVHLLCLERLADEKLVSQLPAPLIKGLRSATRKRQEQALMGLFFWLLNKGRVQAYQAPNAMQLLGRNFLLLTEPVGKEDDWNEKVVPLLAAIRCVANGQPYTPQRRSNVHIGRGYVGNSRSKAASRGRGRASGAKGGAKKRGVKGK